MTSVSMEKQGIVDSWLLIPKGIFIFMSLAYYCVYTFREFFLEYYLGLSNVIGWFGAVFAVFTFFGGFVWAKASDLTGDYTTPLTLSACLACVSFYGMYFLTPGTSGTLWIALVCFAANSFFISAFQPLVDVLVLRLIPDKDTYGRQRLFLPITYGCITTSMGLICKRIGWAAVFPAMSLLNATFITFIFFAVRNPPPSQSLHQARQSSQSSSAPGFWSLFRIKRFLFVMAIVFFIGVVRGIFTVFLSGYQKNVIGISFGATSITPITGLLLEIPIFFYGKTILNFLGVDYCLLLALFCGLVRIFAYLILAAVARQNPGHDTLYGALVCTIELLKGPCFAFTHSAAIKIVLAETPEILHGRAQAFYAGLYNYLSTLVSSLLGQYILSLYKAGENDSEDIRKMKIYNSGKVLFALAAIFTIIAMVLSIVRLVIARRTRIKNDANSAVIEESHLLQPENETDDILKVSSDAKEEEAEKIAN